MEVLARRIGFIAIALMGGRVSRTCIALKKEQFRKAYIKRDLFNLFIILSTISNLCLSAK